jgi:hypothetical protein
MYWFCLTYFSKYQRDVKVWVVVMGILNRVIVIAWIMTTLTWAMFGLFLTIDK